MDNLTTVLRSHFPQRRQHLGVAFGNRRRVVCTVCLTRVHLAPHDRRDCCGREFQIGVLLRAELGEVRSSPRRRSGFRRGASAGAIREVIQSPVQTPYGVRIQLLWSRTGRRMFRRLLSCLAGEQGGDIGSIPCNSSSKAIEMLQTIRRDTSVWVCEICRTAPIESRRLALTGISSRS